LVGFLSSAYPEEVFDDTHSSPGGAACPSARGEAPRRVTRQRQEVLDAIQASDRFLSAQEIHGLLLGSGCEVGLTTVYRTLQRLSHEGVIDVRSWEDGQTRYRRCGSVTGGHVHLVCRVCANALELSDTALWSGLGEGLEANTGYAEIRPYLEFLGVCPACQRSAMRSAIA